MPDEHNFNLPDKFKKYYIVPAHLRGLLGCDRISGDDMETMLHHYRYTADIHQNMYNYCLRQLDTLFKILYFEDSRSSSSNNNNSTQDKTKKANSLQDDLN